MSSELTNDEIRQKLLDLNYNCGPVTETTRGVYLVKLASLNNKLPAGKKVDVGLNDDELRSQLMSYGETVAPITSANRQAYLNRLAALKKSVKIKKEVYNYDGCEPMEVDPPDPRDWTI